VAGGRAIAWSVLEGRLKFVLGFQASFQDASRFGSYPPLKVPGYFHTSLPEAQMIPPCPVN